MTEVKLVSIPIWYKNFMAELIDLAPGYVTDPIWNILKISVSFPPVMQADFKYLGHNFTLMFNDQNNIAMLAINGTMQYYEYADPDFTPNKVLKDIRGKT